MRILALIDCSTCHGTGRTEKRTNCSTCLGTGELTQKVPLEDLIHLIKAEIEPRRYK